MPAYVVADLHWTDQDARAQYGARAREVLARYEGRYIVAGGAPRPLEGDWQPSALAVIEFPSAEHARRWYDSVEYRPLRALRNAGATVDAILVDGISS
jgi:uncharacterized protein (DUF1330 family)